MTTNPLAALDAQRAAARATRALFDAERQTSPTPVPTDFATLEVQIGAVARKADTTAALRSFGLTTAPGLARKADAVPETPMPETVRTWADALTFAEQGALAAIVRLYQAEGNQPITLNAGTIAPMLRLSMDEDRASLLEKAHTLLQKLIAVGALIEHRRIAAPSRFEPVARPPQAKTQKADAPAPVAVPSRVASALGLRGR